MGGREKLGKEPRILEIGLTFCLGTGQGRVQGGQGRVVYKVANRGGYRGVRGVRGVYRGVRGV